MTKFIMMIGAPGAGKGTFYKQFQTYYCGTHALAKFSPGEELRAEIKARTPLGRKIEKIVASGNLVSGEIIGSLFHHFCETHSQDALIFLDGFPRNASQNKAFQRVLKIQDGNLIGVLHFKIDDSILMERILNRAKREDRADDLLSIFRQRLKIFKQETWPLLSHYRSYVEDFDASLPLNHPARVAFFKKLAKFLETQ